MIAPGWGRVSPLGHHLPNEQMEAFRAEVYQLDISEGDFFARSDDRHLASLQIDAVGLGPHG